MINNGKFHKISIHTTDCFLDFGGQGGIFWTGRAACGILKACGSKGGGGGARTDDTMMTMEAGYKNKTNGALQTKLQRR